MSAALLLACALLAAETPRVVAIQTEGKRAQALAAHLDTLLAGADLRSVGHDELAAALDRAGAPPLLGPALADARTRLEVSAKLASAARAAGAELAFVYIGPAPKRPLGLTVVVLGSSNASLALTEELPPAAPSRGKPTAKRPGPAVDDATKIAGLILPVLQTLAELAPAPSPPSSASTASSAGAPPSEPTNPDSPSTVPGAASTDVEAGRAANAPTPREHAPDHPYDVTVEEHEAGRAAWTSIADRPERIRKPVELARAGLLVTAMGGVGARRFSSTDPSHGLGGPYELASSARLGFAAALFPASFFETERLGDVGLTLAYRRAVGLRSSPRDLENVELSTRWTSLDTSLVYRLSSRYFQLVPELGYSTSDFVVTAGDDDAWRDQVASTSYHAVRAGLTTQLTIARVSLALAGGYRYILDPTASDSTRVTQTHAWAFDAAAILSVRVAHHLVVGAEARLMRFEQRFEVEGDEREQTAVDLYPELMLTTLFYL